LQSILLYGSEAWTPKQDDKKCLQAFHVKAQRRILQISCYNFITSDSIREQAKLVDLPLVTADRRHAILSRTIRFPEETSAHTVLQHVINITKMEVTLQQAGRVDQVDHGRQGYKSSQIRTVTLT